MKSGTFAYVWQYVVRESHRSEFLAAYGPTGDWVRLFSKDPAYIETVLLHDADHSDRYVTVDYWESRQARDSFRERYAAEFAALDSRCEKFTVREEFIGDFVVAGDSAV